MEGNSDPFCELDQGAVGRPTYPSSRDAKPELSHAILARSCLDGPSGNMSNRSSNEQGSTSSKRLVLKIEEHLQQRGHPLRVILDLFQDIFTRQYAEYIENE